MKAEGLAKRAKIEEQTDKESTVTGVGKKSVASDSDVEVIEIEPGDSANSSRKISRTSEEKHKSKSKDSSGSESAKNKQKSDEHKSHSSKHKHHKDSHRSRSSSHSSSHRSSSTSSSKHKDPHKTKKHHEERRSSHSHKHKSSSSSSRRMSSSKESITENVKSESQAIKNEVEMSDSPAVTSTTDDNAVFSMAIDEDATVPDDFLYPSDEEDDPEQIALECYKLFQDYKSEDSGVDSLKLETLPEPKNVGTSEPETDSSSYAKKRVAHPGAVTALVDKTAPVKRKETAREQLFRRMQTARDEGIGSTTSPLPSHSVSPPNSAPIVSPSKRRIAHVSNATALMKPLVRSDSAPAGNGDSKVDSSSQRNNGGTYITLSQTVAKGEKRLAHAPKAVS